jgi:hypothetical protein
MTSEMTYHQASDAEVIAWAVEAWRECSEDEPLDVEGFTDVSARFGEAVQAVDEHDAEHLIQSLRLWVIADDDAMIGGFLVTVDLPCKLRLSTHALEYRDLIPRGTPADSASTYRELLEHALGYARRLVTEYETAR